MGEIADYYVERAIWGSPRMPRTPPKKVFCKTCGEQIRWGVKKGAYIPLEYKSDAQHYCKPEELR